MAESAPQEGFVHPTIRLQGHPTTKLSTEQLARRAQLLLLCRRRRLDLFDPAMFDEPAWDGLLALYMSEQARLTLSVASLAEQIGVRLHIMMRWIDYLDQQGLVIRGADQLHGRPGHVRLSDKGRSDLEHYLSGTLATDCP
jgi:DNA-binding MarR family transcriptional regulator